MLGLVFTRPLVEFLAPGFDPAKMDITIRLTRIMLPFLPLVSFAALAMGMLNAQGRFGIPAAAPAMFNLVSIAWAAGLWAMGFGPEQVAIGWAIGTVLGGAAQLLIQVPPLWREGWRYRPEWKPGDPGIRAIGRLMAPATWVWPRCEVNILVNTMFASREDGAVAWLAYAFRILYLPIGIFGVAVGTVTTTGLSRQAAEGDTEGLRQTLRRGLAAVAFLSVPATVGLVVLRIPIVRLLFERGRFDAVGHRADRHRARAVLDRPRRLHRREGPRPRVLRHRHARACPCSPACPRWRPTSVVLTPAPGARLSRHRARDRAGIAAQCLRPDRRFPAPGGRYHDPRPRLVRPEDDRRRGAHGRRRVPGAAGDGALVGHRGLVAQLVTGLVPVAVGGAVYAVAAHLMHVDEARTIGGALARRLRPRGAAAA